MSDHRLRGQDMIRRLYVWWRLNTSPGVWRFRRARRAARRFNQGRMRLPPPNGNVFDEEPPV